MHSLKNLCFCTQGLTEDTINAAYGDLYLKGMDFVVVSQNKSFVHRKSMDGLTGKFEPEKWDI